VRTVGTPSITDSNEYAYTLTLTDGVTASGTVYVTVERDGYNIDPPTQTVWGYYAIPVEFQDVTANGSATETTNMLTLTFNSVIVELTAEDIEIRDANGNEVAMGTVGDPLTTGTEITYTLELTSVTASGRISVTVGKDEYNINPSSRNVDVFTIENRERL
jgi:hypothetical protein